MQMPVMNYRTGKLQTIRDQKNLPLPVFRTAMLRTRVTNNPQQPVFRTRLQQPLIAQQPFRTVFRTRLQPRYRSMIQHKPVLTAEFTEDMLEDEVLHAFCPFLCFYKNPLSPLIPICGFCWFAFPFFSASSSCMATDPPPPIR
jgi:hypothetical protein